MCGNKSYVKLKFYGLNFETYCVKELITEKEPMSKVQAIWEQVQLEWNNSEKMIKFRD